MSERLLRTAEVLQRTGMSRTTQWRLEKAGAFPRRRLVCGGSVAWLESEIVEWIRSRPVVGANDPRPAA